ncbi:MAG: pyruvate kinase [Patescibacteria group bacterium]|nr:pyruvate kinase [Patescibacteria group bacterium]
MATTKIIATLGPSSKSKETIRKMADAGMDIARLNFSWGNHTSHAELISFVREASKEVGKQIEILLDLSGPRIKEDVGHHVDQSSIIVFTEKDRDDAIFGVQQGVDYVALSYVKGKGDIDELRAFLKEHNGVQKIIAKIERREAVVNLEGIIESSDMIMVARGDLGNEFPLEEIPFVEKEILDVTNRHNMPAIVATQMLLSMTDHATPSRAEVTDEVFAIIGGAEAVMLSEETATGKYPVEAVAMMKSIAEHVANHIIK